ncbi:MAG: tryptophan synthase subunit alpha [Thiomicrospira sp.]|uniref:tryptophan synthase subunit alpha n=1 Tax=Thiomicrospira sp. TaxID=935 RepID=UPI0019EB23CE|nr:tryptophan synthase subunit alpha [Thiomicrospira sp.]MBE0493412.1 tryptophan synthase subunit alpha [Thiomicrospira sp.]
MNRIKTRLAQLKAENRTALIPYITAGDPEPTATLELMKLMVEEGADLIELGVPFSDPMADGPVIQKAVERALKHNMSLKQVLSVVKQFRETDNETPVLLMGYLNPVEAMGFEHFAQQAELAGLDGVLTVDMPPEETAGYTEVLAKHHLDRVFLVSPTTPKSRLKAVAEQGSGFVYYVSLKGVTGTGKLDVGNVRTQVDLLKQQVDLPVGIGFGIRDAESAYQMAQVGEAVIIGSALVSLIEQHQQEGLLAIKQALIKQMRVFRHALDQADKGEVL